jgi:hypothetical protein
MKIIEEFKYKLHKIGKGLKLSKVLRAQKSSSFINLSLDEDSIFGQFSRKISNTCAPDRTLKPKIQ